VSMASRVVPGIFAHGHSLFSRTRLRSEDFRHWACRRWRLSSPADPLPPGRAAAQSPFDRHRADPRYRSRAGRRSGSAPRTPAGGNSLRETAREDCRSCSRDDRRLAVQSAAAMRSRSRAASGRSGRPPRRFRREAPAIASSVCFADERGDPIRIPASSRPYRRAVKIPDAADTVP